MLSNINISNNINKNKLSCGNINFQNDISSIISNCTISNNRSLGNGGGMYE